MVETALRNPHIVLLEHDPACPPHRLADWLTAAGAQWEVLRLHAGDPVPTDLTGIDGLISLGGSIGVRDDDQAPWLEATRTLLTAAIAAAMPTLGICLGAQLLADVSGGHVAVGDNGPEIGAYLVAKRDAAEEDPLFQVAPLSPDVMQCHFDAVTALPRGSALLMTGPNYPNQAFRIGSAAWGVQFHIETTAAVLREWFADPQLRPLSDGEAARAERRCGPLLDEADEMMSQTWPIFINRFVELVSTGVEQTPFGTIVPRLPLVSADPH